MGFVKISLLGLVLMFFSLGMTDAGSFQVASKQTCEEVEFVVKGTIAYKDSMKSGHLGFHHCLHRRLGSNDFPKRNPKNEKCRQVDVQPEVVAIHPPLPHEANPQMPLFGRPNPYHIPEGSVCEVSYVQYYFRP